MRDSNSGPKDSVTQVAEESFVRARPIEIERGTVLAGRYQVEDILGKGGSGIVLRVFDRTVQNVVALKLLKAELALDAKWDKRFSRELRLGRPIQHPNVCRIFDISNADGYRFLTMELAARGSLRDELKRTPPAERPIEKRLADVKMAVAGLAALHAGGVVHRDFKPDNLLRMEDGRLVISDFGLATDAANAPGATILIGTPHYMAPEVLAGEPATSRSDVWALGVVLHEIVFGQRPERRSVSFDGMTRSPLRPTSTEERFMLALCERCLADAPLDRPADAGVVAKLLESARPSRTARGGRRRARYFAFAVAASLVAAATIGALRRRSHVFEKARRESSIIALSPDGPLADWSNSAKILAEVDGRIHCLAITGPETARIIWGTPRRAEDIELATGKRHPSALVPETYRVGCPEVSPSGKSLLFAAQTAAGAAEVRISDTLDGSNAVAVTSGSEPTWLGTDDEFAYQVDRSHAAVFSRPTMTMSLLAEPSFGEHHVVIGTATSRSGHVLATLLANDKTEFAVTVYSGVRFDSFSTFAVPTGTRIQFENDDQLNLTSYRAPPVAAGWLSLDWKRGRLDSRGYYSGFDVVQAVPHGNAEILAIRRLTSDVWLGAGRQRRRLTGDGQNSSMAISNAGDLLLSKRDGNGNYSIWRQDRNGATKRLTWGTMDVGPQFGPDGRSWCYADYATKSIVACDASDACRSMRRDDMLAVWPTISPDGRFIAYLTQIGAPKLTVFSIKDGSVVSAPWDAHYQCAPIWSSATTLWDLEMSEGRFAWYERDTTTGARTGRHLKAEASGGSAGEPDCWPAALVKGSGGRPAAHLESSEFSRIVQVLPSAKG